MISTNMDIKLTNNTKIDKIGNINLEDLGLILRKSINEIKNGKKGKNAYEALDEIELEVFGEILRNRS